MFENNKNYYGEFMKKIFICLIILFIFAGCTKTNETKTEYYNAYKNIAKEDIVSYASNVEMFEDISDSKYVYDLSSDVALITIISIDGGNNYGEQTKEYCYPYTYGKFAVEKVYKGDLNVDEEYNYIRAGGIIDFESYYNSLSDSEKAKHDQLSNEENPAYIEMKFSGDIDVEVGKTYLAYMNNPKSGEGVYAKENAYVINSFQGGLREVDTTLVTNNDFSNIKVLNNFNNTWENLGEVIN